MALRAGRVGVNPADVNPIDGHISKTKFIDSPVIIAVDADGNNIYMVNISATSPDNNNWTVINDEYKSDIYDFISITGMLYSTGNQQIPVNIYAGSTNIIGTFVTPNGIVMRVVGDAYFSKDVVLSLIFKERVINTLNEEEN